MEDNDLLDDVSQTVEQELRLKKLKKRIGEMWGALVLVCIMWAIELAEMHYTNTPTKWVAIFYAIVVILYYLRYWQLRKRFQKTSHEFQRR